ncbi:MAG: site-specific DNA-methyltransferase [Chloroflexi bacterium]|nr:site-specific DNA-methyltransferase [Chloroflexota bacterium]
MIVIKKGTWQRNLKGITADLVFTSPPYNIGSKAARKDGYRAAGKFDPKSYGGITGYADNLPEEKYQAEQVAFLNRCATVLSDDGVVVYNHKPRRKGGRMIHPMSWIGQCEQLELMEEVVWDRGSTHNHCPQLMWPTTERLYVLKKAGGRYPLRSHSGMEFRSDVWRIPLTTRPHGGHACPFALKLASAVIEAWSSPGDLVCDPYTGSGTTAIAAKELGRDFYGIEKSAKYHAIAKERVAV